MKTVTKNIIAGVLTASFFGFLIWQYYQKSKVPEAQARKAFLTVYDGMICDEPIPLGETIAKTQELIGNIKGYYDQTRTVLDNSIQKITAIVGSLNENQQGVCNFTKCQADVTDKGIDAAISLQMPVGGEVGLEAHAANCQPEPAKGEPCPDVTELAKGFEADSAGLALFHTQVKEIFTSQTIPLPDDLKKSGDTKFQKVTLPELIKRNAGLSREWLTPSSGGSQRTCALTLAEQAKVARGEMGDVAPAKCREAVEKSWYWPKATSPFCTTVCKEGINQDCKNCLAVSPGENASVLAKVNYRIFGVCKDTCKDELNVPCQRCICSKEDGSLMTTDECLDLLCGQRENYVCCHQNPLELEYYIADDTEAPAAITPGFTADFSSYAPEMFYRGKLTSSGKGVGTTFGISEGNLGDLAVDRKVIPLGACVKIREVKDLNTPLPPASRFVDGTSYDLYDMYFCASDVGAKDHIFGNRIDMWLPVHKDADDWGRRKVEISWWYNPARKCYKDSTFCSEGEPAQGSYGNVSAHGLKFAFGNDNQWNDASDELKSLLSSIPTGPWLINSISDSEGMARCSGSNWMGKPPCAHAQNSCHYGGKNCAGASYGFDVEATGPNDNDALAVALVACQWGKTNNTPVTAVYEEPSHIHISIKNVECDCDAKGLRKGNICQ